jgi:hypothetical protein
MIFNEICFFSFLNPDYKDAAEKEDKVEETAD